MWMLTTCLCADPTDPPGKPVVVDSAKNFIKVQWDKPKRDGGAPVTGYNIERKDPRTGTWNKLNDDPIKVYHTRIEPVMLRAAKPPISCRVRPIGPKPEAQSADSAGEVLGEAKLVRPARGSGERCKLPQRGPGQSPAA